MLSYLRDISFIRIIIPFVFGIVGYVFLPFRPDEIHLTIILVALVAIFVLATYYPRIKNVHRLRWIAGVTGFIIFLITGYVLCSFKTETNSKEHFSLFLRKDSKVLLQIEEPFVEKNKSYKTVAHVINVVNGDTISPAIGTVMIYLRKDSSAAQLKYGDRVWVKNKFAELPPAKNPREFNYKRFMTFRQVHHQIFVGEDDWVKSESKGGREWYASILGLRGYLLNVLSLYVSNENSLAVANSLILGLREKLDDELIKAYSSSGAMHVLAVSGLHVGIIYSIIAMVLKFLDRNSKTKIAKSIIIVCVIWLYAVLTGLSPSVLRAAMMFTMVAVGKNLMRVTNIYNILAGSAFVLLLYNPYYLMEVGFQLSYLAVVGIVMIQPRIYPLLYSRYWIVDQIWMITAVSIAAQIATFPLGLLYYYQFPVYFLVSNLFVIQLSTIILFLGVGLFALHWVPYLSFAIGWLLNGALWLMNAVVIYIDSLPFALLQGISISVPESWFIYAIIGCMVVFFYFHRSSFLLGSLLMLALFLGWNVAQKIINMQQRKLIVYSIPNTTAIDFIKGTDHLFLADSALLHDYDRMLFHIKHNWWDSGLSSTTAELSDKVETHFVRRHDQFFLFLDKRVALIDGDFEPAEDGKKLSLDYVIISKDSRVKINSLVKAYDFKTLIFDGSNSRKSIRYWMKDCEKLGLDCYDVNEKGAFIAEI